jgi:hypothetical protein
MSNSGDFTAAEVAQLYVQMPGSGPHRVLRGFEKQDIGPGSSTRISFPLTRRDLSRWDTVIQQWVLDDGIYDILVGKSVSDIALHRTLNITYA